MLLEEACREHAPPPLVFLNKTREVMPIAKFQWQLSNNLGIKSRIHVGIYHCHPDHHCDRGFCIVRGTTTSIRIRIVSSVKIDGSKRDNKTLTQHRTTETGMRVQRGSRGGTCAFLPGRRVEQWVKESSQYANRWWYVRAQWYSRTAVCSLKSRETILDDMLFYCWVNNLHVLNHVFVYVCFCVCCQWTLHGNAQCGSTVSSPVRSAVFPIPFCVS